VSAIHSFTGGRHEKTEQENLSFPAVIFYTQKEKIAVLQRQKCSGILLAECLENYS
jgi:hypothetical protein